MKKLKFITVCVSSCRTVQFLPVQEKREKLPCFEEKLPAWLSCALLTLALFPATMFAAPFGYNSHDFNKLQTFLNQVPLRRAGRMARSSTPPMTKMIP